MSSFYCSKFWEKLVQSDYFCPNHPPTMNYFLRLTLLIFVLGTFNSCVTKKDIYYFQEAPVNLETVAFTNLSIQKGDIVSISGPFRAGMPDSEIFRFATLPELEDGEKCEGDTHYKRNLKERFIIHRPC